MITKQQRGAVLSLSTLTWLSLAALPPAALAQNGNAPAWPPAPAIELPAEQDAGVLPPSITATMKDPGRWECTFKFKSAEAAKAVFLAGSFNSWNASALPLQGPDASGVWTGRVVLDVGEHQYKFVINGDKWVHDPQNSVMTPDGHSGYNSVVKLGKVAQLRESAGAIGDEKIDPFGLDHDNNSALYLQALAPDRALFRYRTFSHDLSRVWLAIKGGGEFEMHVESVGPLFTYWETFVNLPDSTKNTRTPGVRQFTYCFVMADGGRRVSSPFSFTKAFVEKDVPQTPEWAKHAVWYQIMVDRFRNGNPSNDPDPVRPWTSEWFTPSPFETATGQTFYKHFVFLRLYGGDIDGLESKLPYLKELGVNALYLNPVFKAESHHKYNATNYLHIDDNFGKKGDYDAVAAAEDLNDPKTWKWTESDKRFLKFVKAAHAQGFKVVLDGVFNHVGTRHPAFQDVVKNGQKSKYADWFDIKSWAPFEYIGWAGVQDLPAFKKTPSGLASDAVKQHIFNVTKRWMAPDGKVEDGIDGWRLDVPNEIALPFWEEWRGVVKSTNPNAYITGEIWDRADQWVDGKHFDAVMNYQFAKPVLDWIINVKRKLTVSQLDEKLAALRLAYPAAATYVMQNLVDSHDTDRLASMCLNPDRDYDAQNRIQDNGPNYNNNKPGPAEYQKARLVAFVQMTYVGAPMVYYGDEVGMWGADDPTCRKPMLWEDLQPYEKPDENFVMKDLMAYYKQIIALRNAHPALRIGEYQTLLADDAADVWVFLRDDGKEQLIVAVNASPSEKAVKVPMPERLSKSWKAAFGAQGQAEVKDGLLTLTVPPVAGAVWLAK